MAWVSDHGKVIGRHSSGQGLLPAGGTKVTTRVPSAAGLLTLRSACSTAPMNCCSEPNVGPLSKSMNTPLYGQSRYLKLIYVKYTLRHRFCSHIIMLLSASPPPFLVSLLTTFTDFTLFSALFTDAPSFFCPSPSLSFLCFPCPPPRL